MRRFVCNELAGCNESVVRSAGCVVELPEHEAHHASRVLRMSAGEEVELLDGEGRRALGVLLEVSKARASVRLTGLTHAPEPRPRLTIATAMPKGPKAEDMVDQLSQLGADVLAPMITQRSVTDPRAGRLDRMERHALEAAKQCGRAYRLRIEPVLAFSAVLRLPASLRLIALPGADAPSPIELVARLTGADAVVLLIGPEGGFTQDEESQARAAGCTPVTLGPYVMRIETAAAAGAALLRRLSMQASEPKLG